MTAKTINFRDLPPDERKELIAALESDVAALRYVAGDRIEDLSESVQDAVNEVIRVAREHGDCQQTFPDLSIMVMATQIEASIEWAISSLATWEVTKRGIVS